MKKTQEKAERILGRRLARELRGADLEKATGAIVVESPGQGPIPIQPLKTTTEIQPPDTINDGYVFPQ